MAASFADDIFECIFLDENLWIANGILLKYGPYGLIENKSSMVQIMEYRRPGYKPLSEPMLA